MHPSLVRVYNQLNENERSSYYPAIQSASSVKKNHYNHYKRSHTQFTEREEDSVWATRGGKTDSLPCIYVLCSPLFLTKMSLGTLTFERKELSENEMIYGLTILKFVEKIGIYITHFNNRWVILTFDILSSQNVFPNIFSTTACILDTVKMYLEYYSVTYLTPVSYTHLRAHET